MAKGRKSSTNRQERLLGSLTYNTGQENDTDGGAELGEEDVWSMVENIVDHDDHARQVSWSSHGPQTNHHHRIQNQRWMSKQDRYVGGLSLAFDDDGRTPSSRIVHQFQGQDNVASSQRGRHIASSAPVNVPNWSKIIRVDSVESLHDSDDGDYNDSERVPPHEYLAREYARSHKMAATSVFEGVGRTLKGRDLSRVRDAVWSQTGFDG